MVYILCNIPLDIPVDKLVTWRELVGDGRLARALEACEENGWEALPLAAEPLSDLLPELWSTPKAAERWMGNNPLNPNISIIRLWGVIHLYRPQGRRPLCPRALSIARMPAVHAHDQHGHRGARPWDRRSGLKAA